MGLAEFNVLGPVTVTVGHASVNVGGPKQRAVLATLIANAGSPVSTDSLLHAVYGEDAPDRGRRSVQTYVSTLRSVVGAVIVKNGIGWSLDVDRSAVDAVRFEDAHESALALAPFDASALLRDALGLWRGPPYADVEAHGVLDAEIARLGELRLSLLQTRIDADLTSGRTVDLIGEIDALLAEHPYQERFRAHHMLALYRAGRQTEALRSYQQIREVLVNELGIDPGFELQDLERRILEQDETLLADVSHQPTPEVAAAASAPSGTATFLFTDLEGSTDLWQNVPVAMEQALEQHDELLRSIIDRFDGYVFTTAGDSFAVAFARADSAIRCAIEIQRAVFETTWPSDAVLRVRMALHTGTAVERDGDYFGPVVNRCARLMSAGHGGQLLVSQATVALASDQLRDEIILTDLGEHQLKDLSRAERIYQIEHPELGGHFPKLRTVDPGTNNLPIQLTSFVGRDSELAELSELIGRSRLVTLAGPCGSGKTRLALQLAAELVDTMPDGIVFVELAPIKDASLIADTAAAAFGLQAAADTSLVQAIVNRIGSRDLLLVVDNCEHVQQPAADFVAELLTHSSGLRVLTTSQVPLGIGGETVYRVEPLAVPTEETTLARAARFDAVTLFTERAILAKPAFELTSHNLNAIVSICRDLDGIPLALELAAARVRTLSPEQIAERLDERFRLLTGGPREADERHQTLQAAIDWSHDLLGDDEKTLFLRCSVFAGTFDLDAVEAVGAGASIDESEVLDLLTALVDKSLVVVEDENNQTRYRLLESIFHYSLARLEASGEAAAAGLAHAEFFANRAEELHHLQLVGKLGEALSGMRMDRDNLRAALDFGLAADRLEVTGRIISAVEHLWYLDATAREGIDWCTRLLSLDPDLAPSLMASVLHSYGTMLGSWSEPRAGAEILEREVALRRELGEPVQLASALNNLGQAYNGYGARDKGDAALLEAIDLYRLGGESPSLPLMALADGQMNDGEYDRGMEYCRQSLAETQTAVEPSVRAAAVVAIGQCALHLGHLTEARSHLEAARARFLELGVPPGAQDADLLLALVDRAEGRTADAAVRLVRFFQEPEVHWSMTGKVWALQIATSLLEDHTTSSELLGAAEGYYQNATESSSADVQPAWVRADLKAQAQHLRQRLGEAEFRRHAESGARISFQEAITTAQQALRGLTDKAADPEAPRPSPNEQST